MQLPQSCNNVGENAIAMHVVQIFYIIPLSPVCTALVQRSDMQGAVL